MERGKRGRVTKRKRERSREHTKKMGETPKKTIKYRKQKRRIETGVSVCVGWEGVKGKHVERCVWKGMSGYARGCLVA